MKTSRQTSEVTEFINKIEHPLKEGIQLARAAVLRAGDDITEHIKWNAPSFCHNGEDRVTMNNEHRLRKDGCIQLIFHRGAKPRDSAGFQFKDDSGLFAWKSPDRAIVTFRSVSEVKQKSAVLTEVVKKWVLAAL